MRPNGSASPLETRRLLAGQAILDGKEVGEISEIVGASRGTVNRWRREMEKGGLQALRAKPHPGPQPRLNTRQKQQLVEILLAGPGKAGYSTELWTCKRVAAVVAKQFGVDDHPSHIGKMLHDLGWTCQLPAQEAREGRPAAVEEWRKRDWPRIKRGPVVVAAL